MKIVLLLSSLALVALANGIPSPLEENTELHSDAGRRNFDDDENIVAEREFQEQFPIEADTDYMSQREQTDENRPTVLPAKAFGLNQEELEKVYKLWQAGVPTDGDSSVDAFLNWMKKNDNSGIKLGPGQQFLSGIVGWTLKAFGFVRRRSKKAPRNFDDEDEDEEIVAEREFQERFPIEEDAGYMNQREQTDENSPTVLPSKAFGLNQDELEKLYKLWQAGVPSKGDSSVDAFLNWMKKNEDSGNRLGPGQQFLGGIIRWSRKAWNWVKGQWEKGNERRNFDDEDEDEEIVAERELEEQFPTEEDSEKQFADAIEARSSSTETEKSEGYDCETNSPCTADNAVNELFYFAAKVPEKFIQCSAFGNCSVKSCKEGLVWNDDLKTCTIPT